MSRKNPRRGIDALAFSRRSLPGSAPGTLIIDPHAPKPIIRVVAFGPDKVIEKDVEDLQTVRTLFDEWPVTWINVIGLGDLLIITKLGDIFNIHRLALEDVINVHQRPKVEQYKSYCYIVVRAVGDIEKHVTEQISIFLGTKFVLTFQERASNYFDLVLDRIRAGTGRMRTAGPDHLTYALIDAIIDGYFPVLERYGERVDSLEDDIVAQPNSNLIGQIHDMRHGLLTLRRAAWPLREAMNILYREPIPLIDEEERLYLRDCYDHMVQIIDLLENYRDVTSGLMEVYLSSISNRTNEIMKVLTILTAIFVPLTLISGIYGMNFNTQVSPWNMPELGWRWGYPFALGLMALVAVILLLFFKRKGWIGSAVKRPPSENQT
ncbi:MAG: magnesium and cobalt transport protein CorA [Desulfobacterales bacterium CG07_land_8_20_14_0_80_52_14]|nr:MAG: magnesium and cobalt transport protein CorA [Desulfobacterales bacterium CG07_land_8_20_14_0_80_52_14]